MTAAVIQYECKRSCCITLHVIASEAKQSSKVLYYKGGKSPPDCSPGLHCHPGHRAGVTFPHYNKNAGSSITPSNGTSIASPVTPRLILQTTNGKPVVLVAFAQARILVELAQ
jgi:hypothetical protein